MRARSRRVARRVRSSPSWRSVDALLPWVTIVFQKITLRLCSACDVRPARGTQSTRRYIFYFKFSFYLRRLRLPVLSSTLLSSSILLPFSSRLLFISPRFRGRFGSASVKCKCKINIYASEREREREKTIWR